MAYAEDGLAHKAAMLAVPAINFQSESVGRL
jgi:hypothetical protein